MELLKERIRRDGKVKGTDVLKVDSFLNHQMDVELFAEIGKEARPAWPPAGGAPQPPAPSRAPHGAR